MIKLFVASLGGAGLLGASACLFVEGPEQVTREQEVATPEESFELDLNIHAQESFLEARVDWMDQN